MPDSVHWVRNSAEYRAAAIQAYRLAARQIEQAAAGLPAGTWAVILDADDTVLDNSQYQKERAALGLSYSSDSWREWVLRKQAPPVPGSIAFLKRVQELGGKVAIVTNRVESLCPATRQDFLGYRIPFDAMLCKPDGGKEDKQPRWDQIANGLKVLMWVGDNINDFPGLSQADRSKPEDAFSDFGSRFIVIPNPMYGSWAGNPRN